MAGILVGFWDYVVIPIIVLTVVVFVHELGHFLVARWNGVKVETFSIGFGPELFGYTVKSGTRWKISAVPLGGYVKMFGDADATSALATDASAFSADERAFAFQAKTVYQRAAIVAAGPLSNFVFGILVLAVMLMVNGQPRTAPVIGQVQPDSAAATAGLQAGDRVVVVNGEKIDRFQDLQRIVRLMVGDPVHLTINRAGQRLEIVAYPRMTEIKDPLGNTIKTPVLGIVASPDSTEIVQFGPLSAVREAAYETYEMVSTTIIGVRQMIMRERDSDELGGPLRIAKGAGQAAQFGVGSIVFYTILLSINLGLINLFPVPLLDGGHLLFYAVEALQGRPLGPRAQEYGFRVGLILVFALMLFATSNDLVDLKVWQFIKGIVS